VTVRAAIRGLGVVGSFGTSPEELRSAIGGARPQEPSPAPLRAETTRLEEFVPRRELRRVDHFSRMALLGAHLALQDAGMPEEKRDDLGVVIATGYGATATTFGFLDSVIDSGDPCASPTHFSNSVHNAAAAHVSIFLKATGPSLTVSQFELSVASGLLTACQWLAEERVGAVLFGAVDEYCDVLGYCWQRYFGGPGSGAGPLDLERQSAAPGEGAAFFLLSRDDGEPSPFGRPYCLVSSVEVGTRSRGRLRLPEDAVVILGADGHRRCARAYRRLLPAKTRVAAYSPAYGSTPAGAGLDLAVAALSLRQGAALSSPATAESPWPAVEVGEALGGRPVCCLKLGSYGSYGLVTLQGGRG
jgi:3-oxoacyl-[acyl-carrier-protein] synthase II